MIELRNVSKSFGSFTVLDDVSLTVNTGESFVIIGLSGTGKTVTLKHIAGLLDPDSGRVLIDGEQMNGAVSSVRATLRRKMGVVFQSGALINWLSVWDNVALPLMERKEYSMDEIRGMVDEKLDLMQLSDAGGKMPSEISGGMKKRVCLARVLVRKPDIILYDEPTSGLDPVMSRVINNLIKTMHGELGVTSVIVTHDMHSAYEIGDRIAFLYNGVIVQCDVPEQIRNTEDPVVRQFITGALHGPINISR